MNIADFNFARKGTYSLMPSFLYSSRLERLRRGETGFTLIELLVVIIIIGVLAAIALPIFINQQRVAVDASVKSDVRNTVTNVNGWLVSHRGTAVANTTEYTNTTNGGQVAKSRAGTNVGVKTEVDGTYTVCAFDDGGSSYRVAEKAWAFDSQTGRFAITAAGSCAGAVDAAGNDVSTTPVAPSWTTVAQLPDGEKGAFYTTQLSATGNPAPTYALSAGAALPAGLTLSTSGVLSGIPTVNGDFTFKLDAKNFKDSATSEFKLHLDNTNSVPVWATSVNLPDAKVGTFYTTTLSAPAYPVPVYTVKSGSTLPAGLTLDKNTGVLSGTPTTSANFIFTIVATNKKGASEQTFFLYAAPTYVTPVITSTSEPDGVVGSVYTAATIQVNNGAAYPAGEYAFSIDSGSLPPGVVMSSGYGVFSGIPTGTTGPTTYNFVAKVTNTHDSTVFGTKALSITVHVPVKYSVTSDTFTNAAGTASTVPSAAATVGEGTANYTLTPDTYPAGASTTTFAVSSSGAVTGTATVAGDYTFHVSATNGYGTAAVKNYTGTIVAAGNPNGTVSLSDFEGTDWNGKTAAPYTASYAAAAGLSFTTGSVTRVSTVNNTAGGAYALFSATDGNHYDNSSYRVTITGATVGKSYRLSGYFRVVNNSNNTGTFNVMVSGPSGFSNCTSSSRIASSNSAIAKNLWGAFSMGSTCTANSTTISFLVQSSQQLGPYSGNGVYFDDLKLTQS